MQHCGHVVSFARLPSEKGTSASRSFLSPCGCGAATVASGRATADRRIAGLRRATNCFLPRRHLQRPSWRLLAPLACLGSPGIGARASCADNGINCFTSWNPATQATPVLGRFCPDVTLAHRLRMALSPYLPKNGTQYHTAYNAQRRHPTAISTATICSCDLPS